VALYELTKTAITALDQTTFATQDINERMDLQRLLRQHIEVIAPDTLVIAEEFWRVGRKQAAARFCSALTGTRISS